MAKITYSLEEFNPTKALEGALCVVVKSSYSDSTISNIVDAIGTANSSFVGTGICSYNGQDTYSINIESKSYKFNEEGNGLYDHYDCKVMLGTAKLDLLASGNMVTSSSTTTTVSTRGDTTTDVDYSKTSKVLIDSLNARDEFAIHALRELLCHMPDPSSVSDSEMNFYCDKAYRWAANMMSASANARGTYTNEETTTNTTTTDKADVSTNSLTSNTEKLLNNIVAALEKTDYSETDPTTGKVTAYHERVKLQFTELINFLNTYVKKDEETILGLKDIISTLEGISKEVKDAQPDYTTIINALNGIKDALGSTGTTSDYTNLVNAINNSTALNSISTRILNLSTNFNGNTYSIGSNGLGRNKDNPLYITGGGGGFPSKQVLAAEFDSNTIDSFLTFNTNGAVGYSTKANVKSAMLGWYYEYANLQALYSAIQSSIDARIKQWLNATTVSINGNTYNLTVPNSVS